MSGQKLTLLKFPHTTDELIEQRIEGLNKLICESGNDEHICRILEMVISHITLNFEGMYVDATIFKLMEAHHWWKECYDPNVSLSVEASIDD